MDITQVLVNAQSADAGVRTQAEQQIELAKSSNLPLLMSLMAVELANEAKGMQARQLAGLVLKNCLTAKDSARQQQQSQQWLSFDPGTKNQIKDAVMAALSSSHAGARHTAAQVLAAIGFIDLPNGQWPELIEKLVANVTPTSTNAVKQSSLEALGYICEEIDPEVLEGQSNSILTAVVQGMREADAEVRLAGTTALLHSLGFVKKNFENDNERDYIMQTVCETSLSGDKQIKVKAFECIVSIAEQYYDKLARYMQALYDLTLNRIEAAATGAEDDEVGQQAVEFWTTICDEELDLMEEAEEARQNQQIPERESQNFARGAVPRLMPLLLEALCQQDADDDGEDDAWTVAMAAATCIERMARTIDDAVVAPVMTFIQANITSDDWRRREASTLAFGSILEGPRESTMAPLVDQAMPAMIKLIRDNSLHVKDTAAWTIARICEHHLNKLNEAHLWHMLNVPQPGQPPETLGVLFAGLLDHPRVANNVCLALHNLAEHCEPQRDDETNMLSLKFVDLTRALLQCTERPDAGERNLRCSGYEALNTVLSNAAEDTKPLIEQLLPVILQRLEQSFSLQIVSNDDREAQNELQGLLCGSLQVVTQKLQSRATPQADHMMQLFLQVFRAKNSTVHEEALMAVGAVANATEKNFEKYMPHFRPFLSLGLSNNEEHQVCQVAVGVVGDICRALEVKVLPYCDEIVALLLRSLQNSSLNRNVKPPILSCFGDIALAIGGHFEKYMQVTMNMLQQASMTEVDTADPDLLDYLHALREGILEAYTGVLQGLRAENKADVFVPYVQGTMVLVNKVAQEMQSERVLGDDQRRDDVLRAAVGVIGDLASTLGPRFKPLARQPEYKEHIRLLFREGNKSASQSTKQVTQWAHSVTYLH